jgi:hypothetical protein
VPEITSPNQGRVGLPVFPLPLQTHDLIIARDAAPSGQVQQDLDPNPSELVAATAAQRGRRRKQAGGAEGERDAVT